MNLQQINNDIDLSVSLIDLLWELGGSTGQADTLNFLRTLMPTVDKYSYRAEDSLSPAQAAVSGGGWGLLVVHGTDLPGQYVPQVTGWQNGFLARGGSSVNFPKNPWIEAAGQLAFNLGNSANVWNQRNIIVCGHSAGHGISSTALSLLELFPDAGALSDIKNISFGGNGFANRAKLAFFSQLGVKSIRWMNAEDPVPLFPWCCTQMIAGNSFLAPDTFQAILNVQHIVGGEDLPEAGGENSRTLPSAASVSVASSVASWLYGLTQDSAGPHGKALYRTRINALQRPVSWTEDQQPAANLLRGRPTGEEPPLNIPTPPTQAAASVQLNDMVQTAQAAAEQVVAPPPVVNPGFPFEARRGNGVWGVVQGEVSVATPGGKRAAKALARQLNRVARDMDALSDPEAIQAVAFYLQ